MAWRRAARARAAARRDAALPPRKPPQTRLVTPPPPHLEALHHVGLLVAVGPNHQQRRNPGDAPRRVLPLHVRRARDLVAPQPRRQHRRERAGGVDEGVEGGLEPEVPEEPRRGCVLALSRLRGRRQAAFAGVRAVSSLAAAPSKGPVQGPALPWGARRERTGARRGPPRRHGLASCDDRWYPSHGARLPLSTLGPHLYVVDAHAAGAPPQHLQRPRLQPLHRRRHRRQQRADVAHAAGGAVAGRGALGG